MMSFNQCDVIGPSVSFDSHWVHKKYLASDYIYAGLQKPTSLFLFTNLL